MSSKFFNNIDSPLIQKFKGIAENMHDFYAFQAVVGYFRSSGYFKLRKELKDVKKIQILVGINIDNIFRKHDKSLLMLGGEEQAKQKYTEDFIRDVIESQYSAEVEEGILQLCEDLANGTVEMRIDKSKNLHAKFYLCLPEHHNENSDGWVIMGSSNISESGLGITQTPRYELNVAMKDFADVSYCKEEFRKLWEESIPLSPDDIARIRKKTHLDHLPTPYELYIKVLIDAFGDQVEDNFTMSLPEGYMDLKYQRDAVIQGYQMLKEYNGFFLADVVGTGKTIVGAMIAKRFIEENGKDTNVLVVYPPAVKDNWMDTFRDFGITRYTQFVSNGSLSKVLEGKDNYKGEEEFDLVLIDEAHNFRSDTAERYDELQRICKSPRVNEGLIDGTHKKIMLLSATPLNNRPEDFLNLILLFQDARNPNIDGISNLNVLFQPWIQRYKKAMSERFRTEDNKVLTTAVDQIYEEMRTQVLDKILVRRTRKNLINNPEYKADLDRQGVVFPHIEQPKECIYELDAELSALFGQTVDMLIDTYSPEENPTGTGIDYARYRAIEFLTGDAREKYKQAQHVTNLLSAIYRVHMVKRLESSFYAFKRSLHTFLRITQDMIGMFEADKVLIAPDFDVKGMMEEMELDAVIEKIVSKGVDESDFVYQASDFLPGFLEMLKSDEQKLMNLCEHWDAVDEDPKFDKFVQLLRGELFDDRNKQGKLVVFSESVDTLNYLKEKLEQVLQRKDILLVCASNRKTQLPHIQKNFDANYRKGEKLDEYNIILTSDVLAEGVNLHRSNIIINYDSPWNATRLMQRIGRVNRIGSVADKIYNYMFYPSEEGNRQIRLYQNALLKLQGFHSALGEDAQIYSREEILHDFQLFDENVRDNVDRQLELLREIRELYATDKELYDKIKVLPCKSRSVRKADMADKKHVAHRSSIIYITKGQKSQFYSISGDGQPEKMEFVNAAEILKAKVDEPTGDFQAVKDVHYAQVEKAFRQYLIEEEQNLSTERLSAKKNDNGTKALAAMRVLKRAFHNDDIYEKLLVLEQYIVEGIFNRLTKSINALQRDINRLTKDGSKVVEHKEKILPIIENLYNKYHLSENRIKKDEEEGTPLIITSESFE